MYSIVWRLTEASTTQIPGGVTAAKGFKAAGMYGGLRAVGEKPDLALITCDVDAVSAGWFRDLNLFSECLSVFTVV